MNSVSKALGSAMFVAMPPGKIALQRMPFLPRNAAVFFVNPITPCLLAV
ncbi:unnamed protein product [Mycena citricolor]|uniref:Uncharacterized protein n=1 Tax=Mycena citricolor TaxID=2018698 RepID=A0AAD2HC90_9AGAR|nr:unnamed protein product [Mycena citricolor]